MAFDAGTDNDRLRGLEVRNQTLQAQQDRLTQKVADMREMVCAKERSDGTLVINFEALVEKLGVGQCLELRAIIDERWSISGEAGKKPRIKVKAAA